MTTLYTAVLKIVTSQHIALLSALERQHAEFDRVDLLTAEMKQAGIRAEASYLPNTGAHIRLKGPNYNLERMLADICARHELILVPQATTSWMLVNKNHSTPHPAVLLLAAD